MSASGLARWGGLAAMMGGVMWVFKGCSIILTGEQPPWCSKLPCHSLRQGWLGCTPV